MAEFNFCKMNNAFTSARHAWKQTNSAREKEQEEQLRKQREKEEEERKQKREEELRKEKEEEERKRKEKENVPFWSRYNDRYGEFRVGETTPPPEDLFPKVYNVTSSCYASNGVGKDNEDFSKRKSDCKNVDQDDEMPRKRPFQEAKNLYSNCEGN